MRRDTNEVKVRNYRIVAFVLAVLLAYSVVGNNDRRMEAAEQTCGAHLKYYSVVHLASREE
ncbi:MAG: hypothetical protein PHH47_13000 [Gallionella sp.]|nr:hypothetical protein [Gallionella sp.]MDD4947606.1 hypothetical protein [Gallionella sp.]MDD5612452.1 hypothetical protein [Gallionella sp.]